MEAIQNESIKPWTEGCVLEEDEYLLKIRDDHEYYNHKSGEKTFTGFLSKYTQKGAIPVKFKDWPKWSNTKRPDIYVIKECYRNGWKVLHARIGESQSWVSLLHPLGFSVEIYMKDFMESIVPNSVIKNGFIEGEYKWEENKLLKK